MTSTADTSPIRSRPRRVPRRAALAGTALTTILLVAAGCGDDDDTTSAASGGDEMSVTITEPSDGSEVGSPFDVQVDTSVPIGEPDTGRHHVHLYYDGNTADGEYDLVYDESFTIDRLDPGEHTIEAVIANADHSLTDAREEITVMVGEGGSDATDADTGTDYGY
jgi:hypothetical protein